MKKTVCILWLLCTVLASAIAQQTPTTAQIMSKASEYWAKQDYTQAASWYRKAAERGDATAQNCLGNCYFREKVWIRAICTPWHGIRGPQHRTIRMEW